MIAVGQLHVKGQKVEDVPLDIHAGVDLQQLEAAGGEDEHAALGDVEHLLPVVDGLAGGEAHRLDGMDEFGHLAVFQDGHLVAILGYGQSLGVEGQAKNNGRRFRGDVGKAANAGISARPAVRIDVAVRLPPAHP